MILIMRLLRSRAGLTGAALLLVMTLAALAAPFLFPGDPLRIAGPALLRPMTDATFPLGTDSLGRDVLAGLFHGARASLSVGLAAAVAALLVGLLVGTVAGFAGGWVDDVLMRITDAFQVIPRFLLALAFVSVLGSSMATVVVAIALSSWTEPARLVRAEVLSIRERDYVAAARVIGMHPAQIAFREILPNALPPVLALSAIIVAAAIMIESALSFLGFGDPNIVTWGSMMAEGRNVLRSAPFLSVVPGLALLVTVLAVYLLSEGVNAALSNDRAVPHG